MAKRDPNKTARNKRDAEITEKLKALWPMVSADTGIDDQQSLNALIGGKAATFIDLKHTVIRSADEYTSHYLAGFKKARETDGWTAGGTSFSAETLKKNHTTLTISKAVKEYFLLFLQRSFLRHYDELVRERPSAADAEVWIGQNNSDYGLLITPRFKDGNWENDQSEIRHFPKLYWTIGHVLTSGLVVQGDPKPMVFKTIDAYLDFFMKVLVRPSGSKYERDIAYRYCEYVKSQVNPEEVPLLIPELRYNGKDKKHKYRLDFCIIDPVNLRKVGIELSPWSTHGQLKGTAGKTQQKINDEALANFEKEASKMREYFQKHRITTLIYTDTNLAKIETVFEEIAAYLQGNKKVSQLEFNLIQEFL
ncbi:topoisomerase II [Tabrizicola oligotrophica]|uniref:Topoisomerase II n=1 Tax=Tabrizicola oligotrophica TaxID=2710650 RepID=A0A6M0QZY2_9RHOB|nr:topoisomerase II [Tabrizicola oligotrophica]NEY92172.1 topoisomerase II [Tabrizicola oligotrophica]